MLLHVHTPFTYFMKFSTKMATIGQHNLGLLPGLPAPLCTQSYLVSAVAVHIVKNIVAPLMLSWSLK
jgi:hypothetical protein